MKNATRIKPLMMFFPLLAGVATAKLKKTITNLTEVPEAYRSLYEQDGSEYVLTVEIEGQVDETSLETMRRARDHEKNAAKDLRQKISDLELQLSDLQNDKHRGKGGPDVEALEASYKKQIADLKAEHEADVKKLKSSITGLTVGQASAKLAADLFTVPSAMAHHVTARLTAEIGEDGKTTTRVLDKDGNVTGMTLEDLEKELRAVKEWAPFLKAKGGSGMGGHKNPGGQTVVYTRDNAKDMPESERAQLLKDDPEQFKRLFGQ